MSSYDITIIGSGPGGYVAAIRCAQLGLKTVIIEKYTTLGGTCLNVGCIPSKALLDSSEHFHNATHNFEEHGIELKGLKANITQMVNRKNEVVAQTSAGIKFLMDKNKVEVINGVGSFVDKNTVKIVPPKKYNLKNLKTSSLLRDQNQTFFQEWNQIKNELSHQLKR